MFYELYQKIVGIKPLKKYLLLLFVILVLVFAVYWFYGHAFIVITTDNVQLGDTTSYALLKQENQRQTNLSNKSSSIKHLVKKGRYEVLTRRGNSSYFTVVKTNGFLSTTHVSGKLISEKARKFVGDAPLPCMHYNGKVLLTYDCESTLEKAQAHMPATLDSPTYIKKDPSGSNEQEDGVESVLKTGQGELILVLAHSEVDSDISAHVMFYLKDDLSLDRGQTLKDLDPKKSYSAQPYKEGFVVYDKEFSRMLYYANTTAKPVDVPIDKITDKGYGIYTHSVKNDSIVVGYTNIEYEPKDGQPEKQNPTAKTKLAINQNGKRKVLVFSKQYGSAELCGTDKLCLLGDKQLEVYDISNGNQKLLYSVGNVLAINDSKQGLLVSRGSEVLLLDIDKKTGYNAYNLGDYTYCGISPESTGFTICLLNVKQKRVALYVDETSPDKDSIDKKISELLKNNSVDDVSVYDKYIYITPTIAPSISGPQEGAPVDASEQQSTINGQVDQAIAQAKIDITVFKITNPYR